MIDEFLYRRPIPEEKRGGTYHVVLTDGVKLRGPMTPEQAEAEGFPLPAILAEINEAARGELVAISEALEKEQADHAATKAALVDAQKAVAFMTAAVEKAKG